MVTLSQRNVTTAAKSFGYKIFSRLLTVLLSRTANVCNVCVCARMCAMCAYVCNVCVQPYVGLPLSGNEYAYMNFLVQRKSLPMWAHMRKYATKVCGNVSLYVLP